MTSTRQTPGQRDAGAADQVAAWLRRWQDFINAGDTLSAEPLFDVEALGFGSLSGVMDGRDAVIRDQWSAVWPRIKDFAFDINGMRVYGDPGDNFVTVALTWRSLGRKGAEGWYERRGRASLVLKRAADDFVCIHSHFSMMPGIPPAAD